MAMHHIATTTANGSSTAVFNNIPQTYTHLQLFFFGRSLNAATTDFTYMRFNSDMTAGNYASHWFAGDGATPFSSGQTGQNYIYGTIFPGGTATANVFGCQIVDILDYRNTSKNKTVKILGGFDSNGSGASRVVGGLWLSTSAITSLVCSVANAFEAVGTRVSLYGITSNPVATGA
jgi:hypothetical protein